MGQYFGWKLRAQIQSTSNSEQKRISGLYFDGRKDKTLTKEKKGDSFYRKDIFEEHVCFVEQPGSLYLCHTMPLSGTAEEIKNSIFHFIEENNIDLSDLQVIGCDGTPVNTGNRVMRLIEEMSASYSNTQFVFFT